MHPPAPALHRDAPDLHPAAPALHQRCTRHTAETKNMLKLEKPADSISTGLIVMCSPFWALFVFWRYDRNLCPIPKQEG
jgi:hypothetical protein